MRRKYLLDWDRHWRCSFLRPSWWVEFELLEEEVQLPPDEFHHYPWWYCKRKIQSNRSPVRVASRVRIWQSREYRGTRGHLRTRAIGHAHLQWHAYSWRWECPGSVCSFPVFGRQICNGSKNQSVVGKRDLSWPLFAGCLENVIITDFIPMTLENIMWMRN